MYHIPRYRVQLVREATHVAPLRMIASPHDAFIILKEYIGQADREHFIVMLLDTRNRIIGLHIASIGTLAASCVHPREVFKVALLTNTAGVIFGHNHPSGDAEPSAEDLVVTERLKQAGDLLGIPVLDHLILGEDDFVSLKERGKL